MSLADRFSIFGWNWHSGSGEEENMTIEFWETFKYQSER